MCRLRNGVTSATLMAGRGVSHTCFGAPMTCQERIARTQQILLPPTSAEREAIRSLPLEAAIGEASLLSRKVMRSLA